ncbi:MAG: hypothetical protein Q7S21_01770 [archaeon]|nr:hypothetical protein [archaeon]
MISDEEIKKIVLVRLEAMSENIKINLGSKGELRKADLINHVKKGDEIGKLIIDVQMKYLRAMKGF